MVWDDNDELMKDDHSNDDSRCQWTRTIDGNKYGWWVSMNGDDATTIHPCHSCHLTCNHTSAYQPWKWWWMMLIAVLQDENDIANQWRWWREGGTTPHEHHVCCAITHCDQSLPCWHAPSLIRMSDGSTTSSSSVCMDLYTCYAPNKWHRWSRTATKRAFVVVDSLSIAFYTHTIHTSHWHTHE